MTFLQYIENPLGRKNAVFSQRDMYKDMYTKKWDALFLREAGKVKYTLYHDKGNDSFYAHIKIPSEVVEHFYYDVVIKFSTSNNAIRVSNRLEDYDVAFFSNDPSFVFTYERVFHKNGMFVEELKSKASKIALKRDPDEKNPYGIPGYVKSIYFAYLFMKRVNLFSKNMYTVNGHKYNLKELLGQIEDTDSKIAQRQIKGEEVAKKKKHADKIEKDLGRTPKDSDVGVVKTVKNTSPSKMIGAVKNVKSIPSVRTAKRQISKISTKH